MYDLNVDYDNPQKLSKFQAPIVTLDIVGVEPHQFKDGQIIPMYGWADDLKEKYNNIKM